MAETFYDVLGVDSTAEESEITDAYRDRIKETHPDVSDAEDAEERSKKVIEAKEVLTDTDERARYDRLGHDSYVRQTTTNASWADAGSTGTDSDGSGGIDWSESPGDASGSTWSGRGRWRHAEPGSGSGRRTSTRSETHSGDPTAGREATHTDASDVHQTTDSGASTNGNGRSAEPGTARNVGGPVGWATSSQDGVRDDGTSAGIDRSLLLPETQSWVLLMSTFVCYPIMVFSTVFPPFPLVVNVIVGLCTLFLVVYFMSIPEVGVYVFGGWTVLATVGIIASGIEPVSIVSLLALGSTWFPLGLTVLTYKVMRW